MWSRVLQAARVAAQRPISSYFIHLLVSVSVSVPPARTCCWPVGVSFFFFCRECTCLYVRMRDFSFSLSVRDFTQYFCFYSYHQCFLPPPPPQLLSFPSPPKHQFPFPASSSHLTQPKPLAFQTFAIFTRMAFCYYCSLSFLNYNSYYCKVYLEETFVYNTITILS